MNLQESWQCGRGTVTWILTLILDSHDLTIAQWLQEKQEQAATMLA